jgi:transcriptional regulator with XRE-family HTH domain
MSHTQAAQDPTATIAKRVKELRVRHGWSATQLGKQLEQHGIPWDRFTVASLENGKRQNVTVTEWLALARVLDVAPIHLLFEPEVPGTEQSEAGAPYQVTPTETVRKEDARAWVRGMDSLTGTDLRIFYSEAPAEEWGCVWALTRKPTDVEPDARFSEPSKWLRRAYGGYGNPDVIGRDGDDGE